MPLSQRERDARSRVTRANWQQITDPVARASRTAAARAKLLEQIDERGDRSEHFARLARASVEARRARAAQLEGAV